MDLKRFSVENRVRMIKMEKEEERRHVHLIVACNCRTVYYLFLNEQKDKNLLSVSSGLALYHTIIKKKYCEPSPRFSPVYIFIFEEILNKKILVYQWFDSFK